MSTLSQDSRLISIRARIPVLAGAGCITALKGGLTNRNYRVDMASETYLLRVSEENAGVLGINRENERINTQRAHQAGVGPALIDSIPGENVLVLGWIEAETLHAHDILSQPLLLPRVIKALRMLHSGPVFQGILDFPALRNQYLKTVQTNGYFIPDQYIEFESRVSELEKVLKLNPENLVPCNNDLLAENFMDDGSKIWVIDYEYSGQNEPSFEIGNFAGEISLSDGQLTNLCELYWQGHLPSKIARAMAWSMITRYGWVLWASIQEAVSSIEFDFRTWGLSKWNSVLPDLGGNRYQEVLKLLKEN